MLKKFLTALVVLIMTSSACAESFNFLGAVAETKMVPTSYWAFGLYGYSVTVIIVEDKSLASQFGFKPNDLILKINDAKISNVSALSNIEAGVHDFAVFRKNEFINLKVAINQKNYKKVIPKGNEANLPTVNINTDLLEQKYGVNEKTNKNKKRSYQQCIEDEMARHDTYEYYLNNPNTGYGYQHNKNALEYKRARRICDEESDAVKVLIMNY